MAERNPMTPAGGGSRPDPDPTLLTTQQLLRENVWLRQLIETRLDGNDKALELLQRRADRVPSDMDIAIARLKELVFERFKASEAAVGAALAAAKEAVDKSESATTKQIDGMRELIDAKSITTDKSIGDLKERMDRENGKGAGLNAGWGYLVGAGALIAAIAAIASAVFAALN